MTRPVVILVGGATGTGKSTVSAEVADRLGIAGVISTDVVRGTMRAFFPRERVPELHVSSFECEPLLEGFVEQSRHVLVGVRAAVERALEDGRSIVLEGVHLVPGLLDVDYGDALVGECVLRIEDEAAHARHFLERGGARPSEKYLDRFGEIRRLQELIVERAQAAGVAVIDNESAEDATRAVAELVLSAAERA